LFPCPSMTCPHGVSAITPVSLGEWFPPFRRNVEERFFLEFSLWRRKHCVPWNRREPESPATLRHVLEHLNPHYTNFTNCLYHVSLCVVFACQLFLSRCGFFYMMFIPFGWSNFRSKQKKWQIDNNSHSHHLRCVPHYCTISHRHVACCSPVEPNAADAARTLTMWEQHRV